ncbi:MAG: lysylphosphatidylglycerol synthase transmembrane domain-containing protein [Anaerolineales bacterium]
MWRILPGVLLSLIALAAVFYFVDLKEVGHAFEEADYWYLIPVVVVYTTALGIRGLAWRALLSDEPPFKQVFLILNAGYLLNNILPFRLGEIGRAFLLGRKGLGFWRVFTTILIERAFDMALVAGMVLSTLPFIWGASRAQQVALLVAGVVLAGMAALHLLARHQARALSIFERLGSRWPPLLQLGKDRIEAFFAGLSALTDVRRFLKVLGLMVVNWFLAVVAQFLLLRAFVPSAHLLWAVFGQGIVALGVAVPSSPAYVGVLEAAWVGALSLVGVPPAEALAYAFASHLLNIAVTGFIGGYALLKEGLSLSHLYQRIRNETPG